MLSEHSRVYGLKTKTKEEKEKKRLGVFRKKNKTHIDFTLHWKRKTLKLHFKYSRPGVPRLTLLTRSVARVTTNIASFNVCVVPEKKATGCTLLVNVQNIVFLKSHMLVKECTDPD